MRTTQQKSKILNLFASLLLLLATTGSAQLATWNPSGLGGYGPSPWAPSTSNATMSVGGWERGAGVGLTGVAANNAFGGNNWTGASNQDITFTITSNPGSIVSYSLFNLYYRRSSTGPASGTFEYTFGSASTAYTVIAAMSFANNTSTGAQHTPINLGAVPDLQNVQPGTVVKFRILPANGGSAGTWYIFGPGASIEGSFSGFGLQLAQSSPVNCNGQSTGAITANVTGSTPPYTYSWSPAGGTGSVATGLAAGVYSCLVTSATSETTFATYTLTQPALITGSTIAQTNVMCYGGANGSATISAMGGTPNYTYSWSPAGGTATAAASLTAGMYTLTITDSHSCTGTQTVNITQPMPTLASYASRTGVCFGSTVTVNAIGATTYTWTNGLQNGVPFSPTATATYTLYANNATSGCTESNTLNITVNPTPTVLAMSNFTNASLCSGASLILSGFGASSYTWSSGVTNGAAFSPSGTAAYTVSGTDGNNCTGTAAITVTVNPTPTITISSPRTVMCRGEALALTASGAVSYTWSNNASTNSISISPISTTSYSLTGTDANGCMNIAAHTQTVSNCIGIETVNTAGTLHLELFPNPANGAFTIRHAADIDLVIINNLGQIIQSIQLNAAINREVKVEGLDSGIYFIVSTGSSLSVKQKVIVTK